MGGFLPTAAMSVLQLGVETAQQRKKLEQQKKQAELARTAQEAQARSQIAQIRQEQQAEQGERRDALRRALATQRARFGAQGLGGGRSSDAVLAGLAAEAAREDEAAREQAKLRVGRIKEDLGYRNRKSLLDTAQYGTQATFGLIQQGLRRIPLLPF